MLTGKESAMPCGMYGQQSQPGLTIRQRFAESAMQGLMANTAWPGVKPEVIKQKAEVAVMCADALIAALNNDTP